MVGHRPLTGAAPKEQFCSPHAFNRAIADRLSAWGEATGRRRDCGWAGNRLPSGRGSVGDGSRGSLTPGVAVFLSIVTWPFGRVTRSEFWFGVSVGFWRGVACCRAGCSVNLFGYEDTLGVYVFRGFVGVSGCVCWGSLVVTGFV